MPRSAPGQQPAQLGLEHLAVIVLGQRVDKSVVTRAFEAGDVVEAQLVECSLRDLDTRPHDDEGDDFFAPFGARTPNDRDLDEVGMAQQYFLDLARIDVTAAADDHVLGPVAQGQKAILVKAADVAGVQPATAQGLVAGRGVLPITLHDAVAAGNDLADLAGRQLAVVLVYDLDACVWLAR